MGYFVYILYSAKYDRSYTGQTNNLQNRLSYHNAGKVRSTKAYTPWEMILFEEYDSRAEAMKREKWFKSSSGRKLIKEKLKEYLLSG
jgi:putative endonuclease